MWLKAAKWEALLMALKGWIWTWRRGTMEIPFKEVESAIAKFQHAFT